MSRFDKSYHYINISGRRFGRLVALYPTRGRTAHGSVIWHCRCDCGNELDVSYNELMYSNICSCGCQKKEHDAELRQFLTRASGTSLDMLKSKKNFSSNTSGARGVYRVKGRWVAKIVFQKKAYYLGSYDEMADAVAARRRAEELLFENTVRQYEKWKARASVDAEWAEENPFKVSVTKTADGLEVRYLPDMDENKNENKKQ